MPTYLNSYNTKSSSFKLNFGVPQGSCLGPLLFTVYASKPVDLVKHHLPTIHCYADDTRPRQDKTRLVKMKLLQLCKDVLMISDCG